MRSDAGQSLVETLIAAAIVAILLVALLALGTNSQSNSSYARDLNEATVYSNEIIEFIRSARNDLGWTAFREAVLADSGTGIVKYCAPSLPANFADFSNSASCTFSNANIAGTIFWRQAEIELNINPDLPLTLTVSTFWTRGTDQTADAIIETQLTRWK